MVRTVQPDIGLFTLRDENQDHIVANMLIEVQDEANQDIIADPLEGPPLPQDYRFAVDSWSKEGGLGPQISALCRSAHYAHVTLTRQFCARVFSLTISGTTACTLCWERSGLPRLSITKGTLRF